jgi:AcrR family transcriptional regulator
LRKRNNGVPYDVEVAQTKTAPRRRMSAPARREQVLDVATEIVAEHGFQAVSIQSVAKRAGVTRPIVYEHFGALQGLLEAVVKREMSRAMDQVAATRLPDLSGGDPVALMLDSLSAYLAAVEEHPTTWRLVLMPAEGAPKTLRKRIVRGRAAVLQSLTDAVRPGTLPGDLSDDPELTARILSAMADEYARMVLADPLRFPPARLLEHARWWLRQISS